MRFALKLFSLSLRLMLASIVTLVQVILVLTAGWRIASEAKSRGISKNVLTRR